MIVGLIIILIFPFIYFYTQMNNLNSKTSAIKKAMDEGKETYIDPLTGKMHWTKNGALVTQTKLDFLWKIGDQQSIPGDEVIIDLNTRKIYRNYSREKFQMHIQNQINQGKCWCGERQEYRDRGYSKDYLLKYHMKDKYFYRLDKKEICEAIRDKRGRALKDKFTIYCYKQIYNPVTRRYNEKTEISYEEYRKLGGEYKAADYVIRHINWKEISDYGK